MQVNRPPVAGGLAAGGAAHALLPVAGQLMGIRLQPLDPGRSDRESPDERREREARANDEHAASGAAQMFADVMQSERGMEVGSRAWERREGGLAQRQGIVREQAAFQQALEDASLSRQENRASAPRPAPQSPPVPAQNSEAEGDSQAGKSEAPPARAHRREVVESPRSATRDISLPGSTPARAQTGDTAGRPATPQTFAVPTARAVSSVEAAPTSSSATVAVSRTAPSTSSVQSAAGRLTNTVGAPQSARDAARPAAVSAVRAKPAPDTSASKNDANIERIMRFVRTQIGHDRARAVIRLDPPALGKIRVELQTQQQSVTLSIEADNKLAHRLLRDHVESLRQGMESAGIQLERVELRPLVATADVSLDSDGSQQAATDQEGHQGAAHANAEHSSAGMDSHQAASEPDDREVATDGLPEPGPAAESLVNIVA